MKFPNLETPNRNAVRPKLSFAVDGHAAENFGHACAVAVCLVNEVAGPVRRVPRQDQLGNFIPKYFAERRGGAWLAARRRQRRRGVGGASLTAPPTPRRQRRAVAAAVAPSATCRPVVPQSILG